MTHKKFLARFAALVLALAMMAMTVGCGTGIMSVKGQDDELEVTLSTKGNGTVKYGDVIAVDVTIKNKTDRQLGGMVCVLTPVGITPRYTREAIEGKADFSLNKEYPQIINNMIAFLFLNARTRERIKAEDLEDENASDDDLIAFMLENTKEIGRLFSKSDLDLILNDVKGFEQEFTSRNGTEPFETLNIFMSNSETYFKTVANNDSMGVPLTFWPLKPRSEVKYTIYFDATYKIAGVAANLPKFDVSAIAFYVGNSTNPEGAYFETDEMTFNVKN